MLVGGFQEALADKRSLRHGQQALAVGAGGRAQQLRHGVVLADTGRTVTPELVREVLDEEVAALRADVPPDRSAASEPAARLVADLVLADDYVDFLTLPAYELLE